VQCMQSSVSNEINSTEKTDKWRRMGNGSGRLSNYILNESEGASLPSHVAFADLSPPCMISAGASVEFS